MKFLIPILFTFALTFNELIAADIDELQGSWRTKKTRDDASYYQTLEIRDDVLTFILQSKIDGDPIMMGRGRIELSERAGVRILTLSAIEMGPDASSLVAVEAAYAERSLVYRIGYRRLFLVNNMDGDRDEDPELDIYAKLPKPEATE